MKTVRCTACGAEFSDEEIAGAKACPTCGSTSVPCLMSQDVTIRINWHELRILTIWASNWAGQHGCDNGALAAILRRLEAQRPDGGFPSLTVLGEAREAARMLGRDIEVVDGSERTVVKKPEEN